MLSTLKKNKQMIHVVSEIVILTSFIIYFKNRYNTLQKHINLLAERVEEQAGILYRQQDQIQYLLNVFKKNRPSNIVVTKLPNLFKKKPPEPIIELDEEKSNKKIEPKQKKSNKKIESKQEKSNKSNVNEEEISDSEIEQELRELEK